MIFTVPGEPQGKARARVGKFGAYTPEKTVNYENLVKLCYLEQSKDNKISDKPLEVQIIANYSIPKSASKKKKESMLLGDIRPTKKPDIDNIAKVILDSLNKIAYQDDTQVVYMVLAKHYSETPKVVVTIQEIAI